MFRSVVITALAFAAFSCRGQPPPAPPAVRLSFPLPEDVEPGASGEPLDAAIAPGGHEVVFVGTRLRQGFGGRAVVGVRQLWRRSLDSEQADALPGTEGAQLPAWKQTGHVVSFFAGGRLRQMAMESGVVADLAVAPAPAGATWLADGSLLFAPDASGPIRRLLDGALTDATTLASGDTGHVFPAAAGASNDFVYVAIHEDGRRVVRLATGGAEHDLTTTSAHAALVDDVLLHVQDGVLLAYRLDRDTMKLPGRGVPVALDVGVSESGRGLFTASPGLLLHSRAAPRTREIVWLDGAGNRVGTIGDVGDHWQVRLSPDDRHAAVTSLDPLLRTLDIFVMPSSGVGDTERLTLSLSAETAPVWSPDGTRVLFRSLHEGVPNLFARRAHAKDEVDEVILESPLDETPTDWGANGHILFHARGQGSMDVFRLDLKFGRPAAAAQTAFNETDARWSPDGRWFAFLSDESGQPDVYARHADGTRHRVSFGGGTRPRWSRDGRTLFFFRGSRLLRVTLDGARFTNAQPVFDVPGIVDFDVAHRSGRFVVIRHTEARAPAAPGVVLNWKSVVTPSLQ